MYSVNIEKMTDDELIGFLVEIYAVRDKAEALLIDRPKQNSGNENSTKSAD